MSKRWVSPLVIAAMAIFAAVVFPDLPDRIPTHFGVSGEPDDWMARWPGAFSFSGIALGLWLLLLGLRRIDPRRAHYERFDDTYWTILNVITLLLAATQAMSLGLGLGWPIDASRVLYVIMGLFFLILGNYLPRLKSNWWIGIRTPWTLDSERAWRDTHRVGGRTFVIGGLLVVLAALFLPRGVREWVGTPAIVFAVATPVVYSYFAYRRERLESSKAPTT